MNDRADVAEQLAIELHKGQKRKYTNEPYINHPRSVVGILRDVDIEDENTLAAAWLHDVIEDCGVNRAYVANFIGEDAADLVVALTDPPAVSGGANRTLRKLDSRDRLAAADARAQTIKVADLLDNTESIVEHDPNFAKVYMREKALLLPSLNKANAILWMRAWDRLRAYEESQLDDKLALMMAA